VLDSVKRLMRMGATANLVNLLQKQHPADLAQLFRSSLTRSVNRPSPCWPSAMPSSRWKR
jgi:hypothetical protein